MTACVSNADDEMVAVTTGVTDCVSNAQDEMVAMVTRVRATRRSTINGVGRTRTQMCEPIFGRRARRLREVSPSAFRYGDTT